MDQVCKGHWFAKVVHMYRCWTMSCFRLLIMIHMHSHKASEICPEPITGLEEPKEFQQHMEEICFQLPITHITPISLYVGIHSFVYMRSGLNLIERTRLRVQEYSSGGALQSSYFGNSAFTVPGIDRLLWVCCRYCV